VTGQLNFHALQLMLKVYDLRLAEPKTPLWRIALRPNLFRLEQGTEAPPPDKMNVVSATLSRHLKKAKAIIANVGEERFPDIRLPKQTKSSPSASAVSPEP
jgi:hypothetical protein